VSFSEHHLQSFVGRLESNEIDSVVELSISIAGDGATSSTPAVASAAAAAADDDDAMAANATVLCRLRNARLLTVVGPSDNATINPDVIDNAVLSIVGTMVDCFDSLEELTVRRLSMIDASPLLRQLSLGMPSSSQQQQQQQMSAEDTADGDESDGRRSQHITRLYLSDNAIQSFDVELVTSLPNGPEVLDLSGNRLTELMKTADCHMSVASSSDMTTASSRSLDDDGESVKDDDLQTTTQSFVAPPGRNESCLWKDPSHDLATLKSLNVSRNRIGRIDVGLFNFKYRDLVTLDLSYNSLTTIVNGTFSDLYSLRVVNLSHNEITDVDVEAFATTLVWMTSSSDNDTGIQGDRRAGGRTIDREEQYYIRLASCTSGWLEIQVTAAFKLQSRINTKQLNK
jgi:ribosomal protein L12E/L44/L45/RPP1/RPP2